LNVRREPPEDDDSGTRYDWGGLVNCSTRVVAQKTTSNFLSYKNSGKKERWKGLSEGVPGGEEHWEVTSIEKKQNLLRLDGVLSIRRKNLFLYE